MNQAKQLGAVDSEGKNRPVIGQFLKLVTGEKNEFHIFAKGPQGVLLRAFEERPVKLAVPKSANKIKPQDTDSGAMNIVLIVSIAIVVLLFAILISSQ
jgi:hypothetical protein